MSTMHKILCLLAAVACMALASCSSKSDSNVADIDEVTASLKEAIAAGDASAITSTLERVKAYMAEHGVELTDEQVEEYTSKLQQFIDDNKEQIEDAVGDNSSLSNVVSTISSLSTSSSNTSTTTTSTTAAEAVNDVAEAAKEEAAADAAADAASTAIDDATAKAKEKLGL